MKDDRLTASVISNAEAAVQNCHIHAWAMSPSYAVPPDTPGVGVTKAWVIASVTGAWAAYALYGAGVGPWKDLFGWYMP